MLDRTDSALADLTFDQFACFEMGERFCDLDLEELNVSGAYKLALTRSSPGNMDFKKTLLIVIKRL